MSGILNSGKLATLLERLTAARGTLLDNLSSIDAAISSRAAAAVWTPTRSAKLDYLDQAISAAGTAAPQTGGLVGVDTTVNTLAGSIGLLETTASTSTYNVWTTILTYSGAGVLNSVSAYQNVNASSLDVSFRLLIDGNAVNTTADNIVTGSTASGRGVVFIGYYEADNTAFASVPFTTSFTVQFRKNTNSAGSITAGTKYMYYQTS